jgi:transglutaminase-like putative cysteine protease
MSTLYEIRHRTAYTYGSEVAASYGQLHMLPRELPGQRCHRTEVSVTPRPELYRERSDFFGNRVAHFSLQEPHVRLEVTATSVVEVDDLQPELPLFGEHAWESVRDAVAGPDGDPDIAQFALGSPLAGPAPEYLEYAQGCFGPGRGILDAVTALSSQIHRDFSYQPGSTSVSTPLAEAFLRRTGVCQDFAHLAIACLRSLGLPARYVSGYIETDPPPGRSKLTGADGSHAWFSVHLPDAGWVPVDPTNDQLVNARYIVAAVGRDYSDVPPMQGVIYTDGHTRELEVSVDVTALPQSTGAAA